MAALDFNKDVVELSFQKPVLIDFWAEWCGPCKMLSPILEELEKEDKSKWVLVKIDTEENQEIASYFQIQSIPHCKLIYEGKILDEFSGAQTKLVVRSWLDKILYQVLVEEAEVLIDDFDEIAKQESHIPDIKYMSLLLDFVINHPENERAIINLVRHEAFLNNGQSIERLKQISNTKLSEDLILHLQTLKEFLESDFPNTTTGNELTNTRSALLKGDSQTAIDGIISILHTDPKFSDELARRIGIALFNIWGSQYLTTKENRKLFDMAIW